MIGEFNFTQSQTEGVQAFYIPLMHTDSEVNVHIGGMNLAFTEEQAKKMITAMTYAMERKNGKTVEFDVYYVEV